MTVDLVLPLSGAPPTLRPEPAPVPPSANAASAVAAEPTPSGAQASPSLQAVIAADFSIPPPGPAAVDGQTISLATAAAAISQRDLAVLIADLVQAVQNADLPAPVRAAVDQVLASRLSLDAQPSVADIKAALTQSNLLPRAQPAAAAPPTATVPAAVPVISSSGSLKGALLDLQQALGTWLEGTAPQPASLPAGTITSSAAPSVAPLENAVTPPAANASPVSRSAAVPASILPNTSQPLAQSPAPNVAPPAANINATVALAPSSPNVAAAALPTGTSAVVPVTVPPLAANGAPLSSTPQQAASSLPAGEQAVAAEIPVATAPSAVPVAETPAIVAATVAPDLASRVPSLAARPAIDGAPAAAFAADPVAAEIAVLAQQISSVAPAIVDLKQAVTVFEQLFKAWFDNTQADAASANSPSTAADGARSDSPSAMLRAASAATPPPSGRGGPAGALPSIPATTSPSGEPVAAINRLMRETNAALAHQNLLGIASQPASPPGAAHTAAQVSQWMFEIPFATPQGCAVAQFKISREGTKGKKGKQAPVWRAHFSLDVEPMGPVHAQIALSGDRTWISLWAEREESATRLRNHEALLTKSLIDSELIAEIAIHAGVPRQTAPIAGRFLDHQS